MEKPTQVDYNAPFLWTHQRMQDSAKTGSSGEDHAWVLLKRRGDKLAARNFSCPQGELDLVTWCGKTLVFTEVKTRGSTLFGSPAEAVSRSKQEKLRRAANWYCAKHFKNGSLPPCRFDVVWIVMKDGRVEDSGIIEGAFC
jgi:putative endonuclease